MVEIASDRPLFKNILVEMVYSVIHLHNRVNKSRIAVLFDDKKCKENEKKEQPATFEPCASLFRTLP
jgi:hypothetical protein